MDALDRRIVNGLQGGFPVSERPYRGAAAALGIGEDELIQRLSHTPRQRHPQPIRAAL